ncbi:hypothetical protein HHI36_021592 [Cryptolaemus montrouzieri]|uniref:Uncharacterized protein n=1 Tax=Cryptolaemus montrouzieri TaxID=559131 RepID=A0ABD2MXK3_9CUCU
MRLLITFLFLQTIFTVILAEFNKSYPTLKIAYKKFKENEHFEVSDYGYVVYIEASDGIIHKDTFIDIPKIIRFMVYNCNFTSFDLTSLYSMPYLQSIDLMDVTGLHVLTNKIIVGFKNLKRLSFYQTDIKFDHNTFQNLKQLEYLSIAKVDVGILGNDVFTGSHLKELYWTDSGIEKIDKYCFSQLKEIEIINLSRNQIESLAPETFNGLLMLERLYLNRNKIAYFSSTHFKYLPSLNYLDISENPTENMRIEEVIKNIPHLKTLIVDRKMISSNFTRDTGTNLSVISV